MASETLILVLTAAVVFTVMIILGYGSYLMVRDAEIRHQERKNKKDYLHHDYEDTSQRRELKDKDNE